jgi:hypothetical protein
MTATARVQKASVIFDAASPIYFCKKVTYTRCYECKEYFKDGDAYRTSRCGRFFKHADCEKVKGE